MFIGLYARHRCIKATGYKNPSMYAIERLNREIDSCQRELAALCPQRITMLGRDVDHPIIKTSNGRGRVDEMICQPELAVLCPQKITMLGKDVDNPIIVTNGRRERVDEIIGYESISICVIGELNTRGVFDSIEKVQTISLNGTSFTGPTLRSLVRQRLEAIKSPSVTDKASGVRLMSSAITTLAAIVHAIGSPTLRPHSDALVKYLRTGILWDVGMTADRNIVAFFERLADRISSLFVLCRASGIDIHRDAVGAIIGHFRFYAHSRKNPTHIAVMSRVKDFLCGNSLPGCKSDAQPSLIASFDPSELASPRFQATMRLFNVMDTFIGLKSGYSRQGSNAVLELCMKAGRSICMQLESISSEGLLVNVCRCVIAALTSARSRFSESHTFEQRFAIVVSEIHVGLLPLRGDKTDEQRLLGKFLDVLDELDTLKLDRVEYDLELIGIVHDGDQDNGEDEVFTRTYQGFKYNGGLIAVVITLDARKVLSSVCVDGHAYPTTTMSEWFRVLEIITEEVTSADVAMAGIESDFPMSDD